MIEFYNVRSKKKVQVPEERVSKSVYTKKTKKGVERTRYAFKAVDEDGTKLTRFCSKADFDQHEGDLVWSF